MADLATNALIELLNFAEIKSSTTDPTLSKRRKVEFKLKIGFVTGLKRERMKFITKEKSLQMQRLYRTGREKDRRTGWRIKKSSGDELVNFFDRMKHKIELPIYRGLKDAFTNSGVALFQFKMLSDNDDEKFSFSMCYRKTSIVYKGRIMNMIEPDKFEKRKYSFSCPEVGKPDPRRQPLLQLSKNIKLPDWLL